MFKGYLDVRAIVLIVSSTALLTLAVACSPGRPVETYNPSFFEMRRRVKLPQATFNRFNVAPDKTNLGMDAINPVQRLIGVKRIIW